MDKDPLNVGYSCVTWSVVEGGGLWHQDSSQVYKLAL